jgi:APA family basic amino acid/polyamine antiporter
MNLFLKKLPDVDGAPRLRRCLSAWDLTFLGIGNMIGAGIFVLTGVVAATQAGPAIILSFVIAGIACIFVALSYAELAASVGGCGGGYGYSYAAFGELPAWIVGWITASAAGFSVAAVANGWSGYVANGLAPFGIGLPDYLTKGPAAGGVINLPAVLIVLVLMMVLIAGVKQSAKLNTVIVAAKLSAIVLFIGVALFHVRSGLWQPFLPFGWFTHTANGKTAGVLAGAAIVFFAYIGFQNVSIAAEEAENPQRDVPIGTLAAVTTCALLYIAVSGLLTAIAPYQSLNVSSPIAFALLQVGVNWGSALVAVGVIVGLTSTMLVTYYAGTRVLFAMARDGLLPQAFCRVDPKTQIPINSTIMCGILMAAMAGLVPLGDLAQLASLSRLTEFTLACLGVMTLRVTRPGMHRPFRAPGGVILPVLGMLSCGALITFLPVATLLRFGLYLAVGVAVYFGYAARRSRVTPAETPDEIAA